ncbi:MAG: PilC/PilY family type IV pilus protein, partial [Desulfobacterales bacterium]|nr:PilC/PilY family type IV pilus protein [Desulfobacterales bacterium]
MKRINYLWIISIIISILIVFAGQTGFSDDTCVFMTTADDVPPNIVILLDNGAEMKHTVWPVDYNDSVDYTPNVTPQVDIVPNGELGGGNGFYNENGYGIYITGGRYFLVPVGDNLELITDVRLEGLPSIDKKTSSWEINGVTVHLPAEGSTVVDADGVKDNAGTLRYSKNYLNWLFFYSSSVDLNGDNVPEPIYDGSLLPDKSRFYYAKKALMTVAKLAANQAQFGIHNFTSNADGASNVQPLKMVVQEPLATFPENNILISEYINNINNMATVTYSPIAEGLATVAGYYGSPSAGVVGEYCQKNFVIVVSPGISSEDQAPASQSTPASLSDYDDDAAAGGVGEGNIKENETIYSIPIRQNGSTYLDDVAHYLYSNDVVGYQHGLQNVMTYTIGFMGDHFGNLYLKNTSNNGNGNLNLYDTTHEEYGKYHYEAQDPNELSSVLLAAIKEILSGTSSFTAPVVPVTRTTSGNRIYMAFFKPLESNFWEGNVTKFGIADDNTIIDANDKPATWPNGAIRADAIPFWQTKDWADPTKSNYINYSARNIYTYMGDDKNLADPTTNNAFTADNLDAAALGYPTHTTTEIIDYVRGADVFDEDGDGTTDENRIVITGDVLHSEPVVVQYTYTNGTSETMVYFGANDGMLHAVWDQTDPNVDIKNNEINHGKEAWAFIPPDQLHRLKDMVEGSSHQYYVDSSPKVYFDDENEDGLVDTDRDKIILICGERKGGTSYFALDVTDPMTPKYMWRIGSGNDNIIISYDARTLDFGVYNWLGDLTTAIYNDYMPDQTSDPFVWGQIVSSITTDTQTGILELANIKRHARGSLQIGDTLRLWSVATFEWHDAATVV